MGVRVRMPTFSRPTLSASNRPFSTFFRLKNAGLKRSCFTSQSERFKSTVFGPISRENGRFEALKGKTLKYEHSKEEHSNWPITRKQ